MPTPLTNLQLVRIKERCSRCKVIRKRTGGRVGRTVILSNTVVSRPRLDTEQQKHRDRIRLFDVLRIDDARQGSLSFPCLRKWSPSRARPLPTRARARARPVVLALCLLVLVFGLARSCSPIAYLCSLAVAHCLSTVALILLLTVVHHHLRNGQGRRPTFRCWCRAAFDEDMANYDGAQGA